MDSSATITLTREQLYEQVWSTPMSQLCKVYGLSDVDLAKICRAHQVPFPWRGYWVKKRHGEPIRQVPLPPVEDPGLQQIRIEKGTRYPQERRTEKKSRTAAGTTDEERILVGETLSS